MDRLPLFCALTIQTNSRCNLRCRFCFHGQYPDYGSDRVLETDVIREILAQAAGLGFSGRVSLYNMNEPLTDERIVPLLELARGALPGCLHFLSTNGVLLTQPLLGDILRQVDHLRINRYGPIPDLDYGDPRVDLRDKRSFFSAAPSNRGGGLRGLPAAANPGCGPCANPFGQLVVVPPGVAVLCCSDGFASHVVGDVRRETLDRIWYGEPLEEARSRLARGRRSEIGLCRACSVEGGGFYEYFADPARFRGMMARRAGGGPR